MITLHASLYGGRLYLWGEKANTTTSGESAAGPEVADHPLDVTRSGLAAALRSAGLGFKITSRRCQRLTAWLPSKGRKPIPSSPLIGDPPVSRAKMRLRPWTVTACALSGEEMVELLCACHGRQTLASGIVVGRTLVWCSEALRQAGSLAARQQVLPGLVEPATSVAESVELSFRARWEPIFVGADVERLDRLIIRLPPAARALTEQDVKSPPAFPAATVVSSFLTTVVDWLMRGQEIRRTGQRKARRRTKRTFDSIHDAWLHALCSADPVIEADPSELAELAAKIRAWRRPAALTAASPFRLIFRLEEPEDPEEDTAKAPAKRLAEESWQVRYLLQPRADPSLLVPLPDAFKKPAVLKRHGTGVRESALAALGQAAAISPGITASLKAATPAGYGLDATGAFEFLHETAGLLEQAGFGVLLPAWTRRGTRARLRARASVKSPKMQGGGGINLGEIVDFQWEVALGEEKLTGRELETLARLKAPLVRLRGQWVEMTAADIAMAIELWKKRATGRATVRDVLGMALGAGTAEGLEVEGVRATGWIGKLLRQLADPASLTELPAPKTLHGTLRPYQVRGYSWLAFLRRWGLGACLADDMGLGKTVQTLALIEHDRLDGSDPAPGRGADRSVLLICPTSLINNWQKEAARFTPELRVLIHHGPRRKKGAAFEQTAAEHGLVITSYALLHRDAAFLRQVHWAGLVLDEAQNVKNPETRQAQAARSISADYRIALTGTPVENNVGDLWSIMEVLNPGFLDTQAAFKRRFFIPIQTIHDPGAAQRLKRLTGPFILRRLKTDRSIIDDLPAKQEMKVFCSLTREQASLYKAVLREVDDALEEASGIKRRGLVLATLSKLKQVCNHPAQLLSDGSAIAGRSGKLARLTEMLEEILAVDERALIFSQFAEMGALLKRHLQEVYGREVLFLHGGVSKAKRDKMVDHFQGNSQEDSQGEDQDGDGAPPLLILSLKAGGTGLNLTRANHVFHFDRWWNPAVENQATDRAYRIGQKRSVQVHKFICSGTVEEKIDAMIESKKEIAENVVGTGEGWLTELSTAELREVFALRKDAVKG